MAQKTKEQLKQTLVDGHVVTGSDFTDLVDSLKGMQTAVSSPSASGSATAFIDTITQDAEGKIVATKKNVNFTGLLTLRDLIRYQSNDIQVVGDIELTGDGSAISVELAHNKGHFPTVRLLNDDGVELDRVTYDGLVLYTVKHTDETMLTIIISDQMNSESGSCRYVLD